MAPLDRRFADEGVLRGGRRTLAIGAGGSGVLAVAHLKALHLSRFGQVRPATRFLGFDVMETPPRVTAPNGTGTADALSTRLEPGIEYCRLGDDCDPTRLSYLLRANRELNPQLRRLLERQPDGRFTKSLQTGTEGERLYGLVAFYWSLGEVRRLIRGALRAMNNLRLPEEYRASSAAGVSVQVVIVTSIAGGVGSSIALPLCGEVKRAMDSLGMDVNQSTFIGVCFTPDCFPETTLRLSNAQATLNDFNVAQKEAVIP